MITKIRLNTNRSTFRITLLLLFYCICFSGTRAESTPSSPLFRKVEYQGLDQVYNQFQLKPGEIYNPVLQGCYPDPSITRRGNDYFMVCSSFAIYPAIPIFHSTDLIHWKQIGHVLDRSSQLKLTHSGISGGLYAPCIRYNPYNETFYMITTQLAGNMGNMVVKTKDPFQGWSDPYIQQFHGIDPSLFFDDDGKAYVVHNDAPARGKELYEGHRIIRVWEYDTEKDQVIPGTDKMIVDGGVDITQKPIWIEAPHIYKKNNRYYLMCAEGGTGGWHSEVIFSSDSPTGPYKPAPGNPILTQRYLNSNRPYKVDWAGHADLVQTPAGDYFAVFLAVRPNEKNRVNTGRETFMLPVDWSGEFPVFINGLSPIKPILKMPGNATYSTKNPQLFPNGNFTFTDYFCTPAPDFKWVSLRGPREDFIAVSSAGLMIKPFNINIKEAKPTSTLFLRQQHNAFRFTANLKYEPRSNKELAGIVCLQSEKFHYVFGITKTGEKYRLMLERNENGKSKVLASTNIDVGRNIRLRVEAQGDEYSFSYAHDDLNFSNVGGIVSGDILSTNVAGGFTGAMIGLYATTNNDIIISNE